MKMISIRVTEACKEMKRMLKVSDASRLLLRCLLQPRLVLRTFFV